MANRPLGVQISRMLEARGVEVIFGIPGVHNIELYRGLEETGIRHVLARHEQGAGFMADGYARATGRPGVAYVISGPGFTNILTPLGQAYSDSVPVLVISSCLDETALKRGQLHQMKDQIGAGACVTDWSEMACSAQAAFGLIDRAFAEFVSARPRPRHLSLPIALMGAEAPDPPRAPARAGLAPPDPLVVERAAAMIAAAKRPLFLFGGGARGGAEAARALVAACKAASICTYAGRGIIPDGSDLALGPVLARPGSKALIASADLVLVIGSELSEVDLWRNDLGHDAPKIRVDIDPEVLASAAPGDLPVLGDAAAFLQAVAARRPGPVEACGWQADEIARARAAFRAETDAERPGIVPIAEALAAGLPDDTMIYSDMTQFAYAAKEVWPMMRPGHWHHPYGFGTLGYALPAAIGGAVARPGLPTLAIAGDYGFQYTVQELATAVELGLSLPILIWDNAKLGEIEASMQAAQIAPNAVVARNPDFLALARAYGAGAEEPATIAGLVDAVNRALVAGRPTLIRVTPDTGR